MEKAIAIITDKGVPGTQIGENTMVNVFTMEEDKVSGYESIPLESSDGSSLSRLLKLKEVSLVYTGALSNELKAILQKLGISVKCRDQWEGDEFIARFAFG